MLRRWLAPISLVVALAIFAGCSEDSNPVAPGKRANEYDAEMAIAWFDLAMTVVKNEKLSPPLASRLYGYTGVTLYEAVVNGLPANKSLAGQLNELTAMPEFGNDRYHWPTVANAAIATILRNIIGNGSAASINAIESMEADNNEEFRAQTDDATFTRSVERGQLVGLSIANWARNDGFPELNNCAYTPPAGPGRWVPTPPAFAAALQPCWGSLRPFVLSSGAQCMPGPPPTFSESPTSPFYQEMMEVYNTSVNLTDEQLTIARFWSDDPVQTATPPGHSISILNQVLALEDADLGLAAEAYAKVGIAVADAFIACWRTKFEYNLLRPVSCIRDLVDENWLSTLTTPPFPEYTSGHSVQSGAVAQVLTDMFGTNYAFVDHTHDGRGFAPRSFASFDAFATEAAISRLYGGIHFRTAIDVGVEQGECIGDAVNALEFRQ